MTQSKRDCTCGLNRFRLAGRLRIVSFGAVFGAKDSRFCRSLINLHQSFFEELAHVCRMFLRFPAVFVFFGHDYVSTQILAFLAFEENCTCPDRSCDCVIPDFRMDASELCSVLTGKGMITIHRCGQAVDMPVLLSSNHAERASASSRRSFAPLPHHALPCMHASVAGFVEASFSINARTFFVCEK